MVASYAVIGAGISGLTLAWRLSAGGASVRVFESRKTVGGLSATVRKDAYAMDVGPHSFFSDDPAVLDAVLGLFDKRIVPVERSAKIHLQERYVDYPFTARNLLVQMGPASGLRTALGVAGSWMGRLNGATRKQKPESVRDWAVTHFGRHLYRIFFKPYTERFWGLPCTALSPRTIPTHTRTGFVNMCRMLLRRHLSGPGRSQIEREALPTFYPRRGFGEIAERLAAVSRQSGARIELGCRIVSIQRHNGRTYRIVGETDRGVSAFDADCLVSTIAPHRLIRMMHPPAPDSVLASAARLQFRSLVVLGIVTAKQHILDAGYVYFLNRPFTRLSEMNRFSPGTSPGNRNILMIEMPCDRNDSIWNASGRQLLQLCLPGLSSDGVITGGDVRDIMMVRFADAYPVYVRGYERHLKKVMAYLNGTSHVSTLGRTGEFSYMDVDQCVKNACQMAHRLLDKRTNAGQTV